MPQVNLKGLIKRRDKMLEAAITYTKISKNGKLAPAMGTDVEAALNALIAAVFAFVAEAVTGDTGAGMAAQGTKAWISYLRSNPVAFAAAIKLIGRNPFAVVFARYGGGK